MEEKRFVMRDEPFVCVHCGRQVPPSGVTSRDHCPFCLTSRHVDRFPGDRANPCGGVLRPVSAEPHPKKGFVILYRCQTCGEIVRCRAVLSGCCPDDTEKLIALTAHPMEEGYASRESKR